MSELTSQVIYRFYFELGRELQRVRLSKNLSLEDVFEKQKFHKLKILRRMEEGKYYPIFFYFQMIHFYRQKLVIRLEDEQ